MQENSRWKPSATIETLRLRAGLFGAIRAYFARHGVMEVDTPALNSSATVDRHIESFHVDENRWLHTSAEFAMKRLLAAGSGPIYQLCHVYRRGECGRHHLPEFTMLEWYEPGIDHLQLMDDVEALMGAVGVFPRPFQRTTYGDAFAHYLGINPFRTTLAAVRSRLHDAGVRVAHSDRGVDDLDYWLDLAMGIVVAPRLGGSVPCFVYDYPVSQCAQARVTDGRTPVARRFELFWRGVELANGYHELDDAAEYRRRFLEELRLRRQAGQILPPMDRDLLAAIDHGLPDVAGVALGVDRLLMLMLDLPTVADAVSFDADRS